MIVSKGASIELGKGDVEIFYGGTKGDAVLVMRNNAGEHPIGYVDAYCPSHLNTLEGDIVLSFSDTASIDAFIGCLRNVQTRFFPTNVNS